MLKFKNPEIVNVLIKILSRNSFVRWVGYYREIQKLRFQALALHQNQFCSDERLKLETSALESPWVPIDIVNHFILQ